MAAVHPPALAAEQEPAQPQRRPEQAPRPLGLPQAAMLREEPQVSFHLLAEHAPAVRGAAHVHDLRAGEEQHLPPGAHEAEAPVRLLAEDEEVLVDQADGVDRRAADE